jgi:hypothetical protein
MKLMFRCFTAVSVTILLLGAHATAACAEQIQGATVSSGPSETCSPVQQKNSADGLRQGEFQLCATRQVGNVYSYTVTVANLKEKKLGTWELKESQSLTVAIANLTRTSAAGDERRRDFRVGYGPAVQIASSNSGTQRFVASPGRNTLAAKVSVIGAWSRPAGALRSGWLQVEFVME